LTTNTQTKKVGCEIYIRGSVAKRAFGLLLKQREKIEKVLGSLDWQELPEGQDCRIILFRKGNSKSKREWETLHQWLFEKTESFYKVFSPIIKDLPLDYES